MHRELIALLQRGHTVHISTVNNCRLILRSERGMLPAGPGRDRNRDVRDVCFTPESSDACETGMSAGHKRTKIGKSFTRCALASVGSS